MKSNIYNEKKKRIEFGELRIGNIAQYHLEDIVQSGWASYGPKCREFEQRWNDLFHYKHSLATSSGTDAVIQSCLSLYALGAQPQDEIITPALSFIATANAIRAANFTPVFVDVDRKTLNIDPQKIEEKITLRTKAIMVVHTMGRPCDMDEIVKIARKYNLIIIEDACEAHGAMYKGKIIGHIGDAACFSFYIAHLICCGEGGMVSTNREDIYEAIFSTRCHGRSGFYFDHPLFGLNSKMNDLEASLGLEGIGCFYDTFAKRRDNWLLLQAGLKSYEDRVWFSQEDTGNLNCPHGFSLTLKEPNKLHHLTDTLDQDGIHWKRNFGCIPTQHGAFAYLGHKIGDFPESEYIGHNGIHVGVHQYLSADDIDYMISSMKKGLDKV